MKHPALYLLSTLNKCVQFLFCLFCFSFTARGECEVLPWQELTDQILEKSPDIILLAETDHYSPAFPEFYDQFIKYVFQHSPTKYDCFLAETDSRYSAAFDRFFEGMSYEDSISNLHKELKAEMGRTDNRIEQKFSITEKLAKTLKTLGIRVYGFDAIFDVIKGRQYSEIYVANNNSPDDGEIQRRVVELLYIERNQIMAQNISQIMKDNCSAAIAFAGDGHLRNNIEKYYAGYKGGPVMPIQSQLQNAGFQTVTIYLEEEGSSGLVFGFDSSGFGHFKDLYGFGLDVQIYIPHSQTH